MSLKQTKKHLNTQIKFGNGNKPGNRGFEYNSMVSIKQYIRKFNRDKIVFVIGRYEIQIFRDKAQHNITSDGSWVDIPMTWDIYVNDTNRFIQITTPGKELGDKMDIIFEYGGSIML